MTAASLKLLVVGTLTDLIDLVIIMDAGASRKNMHSCKKSQPSHRCVWLVGRPSDRAINHHHIITTAEQWHEIQSAVSVAGLILDSDGEWCESLAITDLTYHIVICITSAKLSEAFKECVQHFSLNGRGTEDRQHHSHKCHENWRTQEPWSRR